MNRPYADMKVLICSPIINNLLDDMQSKLQRHWNYLPLSHITSGASYTMDDAGICLGFEQNNMDSRVVKDD
jgi:hypothetical protein